MADAPTGPFRFARSSPFAHKPTGFAAGAGHSSTFAQPGGAPAGVAGGAAPLWHVSTITISVRQMFERRLGIYPITHDAASGTLVADEPRPYPQS